MVLGDGANCGYNDEKFFRIGRRRIRDTVTACVLEVRGERRHRQMCR
jgi:hypothetical protein